MKRIVTGHFADPTSTRTISEILPEEFDVMKDSIQHIKKKYGFMTKLSNDEWRNQMTEYKSHISSMPLDEFSMPDEVIEDARKTLDRDLDVIKALEARIILLVLSSATNEISELSGDEFRVLIDSVRHYCLDLTNIVNSDKDEIRRAVERINKDNNLIDEKKLNKGLDKITTEEHKEETYQIVQMLYSILDEINQPYEEAEYIDSNGNKLNTTNVKPNPTSIN